MTEILQNIQLNTIMIALAKYNHKYTIIKYYIILTYSPLD